MPEHFRPFRSLLLLLCLLLLAGSGHARAGEKVWRVLYVEGGPFSNYQQTLAQTARGLEKLGLIDNGQVSIPEGTESTSSMWLWLADHARGRITFLRDGHYSAEWDAVARKNIREAIIERVRERRDVDMIIAMGTWSGLDMCSEDLGIPEAVSNTNGWSAENNYGLDA